MAVNIIGKENKSILSAKGILATGKVMSKGNITRIYSDDLLLDKYKNLLEYNIVDDDLITKVGGVESVCGYSFSVDHLSIVKIIVPKNISYMLDTIAIYDIAGEEIITSGGDINSENYILKLCDLDVIADKYVVYSLTASNVTGTAWDVTMGVHLSSLVEAHEPQIKEAYIDIKRDSLISKEAAKAYFDRDAAACVSNHLILSDGSLFYLGVSQ